MKNNTIVLLSTLFFMLSMNAYSYDLKGNSEEMHIVILIDASSSMYYTDPYEYRKMASQAIVSLVSPFDQIAVVEFASNAVLHSDWVPANNIDDLFDAINKVGNRGNTDFLAGLNMAVRLLQNLPESSKKVILLFSDGDVYPNPSSDLYSPLNREWRLRTIGMSQRNRQELFESTFKDQYVTIAKNRIDKEILSVLKRDSIEIFSIGFSDEADKEYLEYLSNQTSLTKNESRFFFVNEPTDLVEAFLALLPYWQNKVILYSIEEYSYITNRGSVFIDEFTKDLLCLVVSDKGFEFSINPIGGNPEKPIANTHPHFSIIPLKENIPPSTWEYRIEGISGKYKMLIVGESTIRIDVRNLEHLYLSGEELNVEVLLRIGNNDARIFLHSQPTISADIIFEDELLESIDLEPTHYGYIFKYTPSRIGQYRLKFTLLALDAQGRKMLPRPSREFKFTVLPRFYVQPNHIRFGTVKRGTEKIVYIKIHNGLIEKRIIDIESNITKQSKQKDLTNLPYIKDQIIVESGESKDYPLKLIVPKSNNWGFYEGNILIKTDEGETQTISFVLHVPSWIEKIGYFIFPLLLLLLALFIYVLIRWSNLKSPQGILIFNEKPLSDTRTEIKLSRVKKGFWAKHLNWEKNILKFGSIKSHVQLREIPTNACLSMIFFRIGTDYIRNDSKPDSNFVFTVVRKNIGVKIPLPPGKSYPLSNNMKIEIGKYQFTYISK